MGLLYILLRITAVIFRTAFDIILAIFEGLGELFELFDVLGGHVAQMRAWVAKNLAQLKAQSQAQPTLIRREGPKL